MKTKPETKECSVVVAFAELGRLERDRAERVAAKQAVRERLARQRRELTSLRERLEAERPRAIARVRRERVRREQLREQLAARLIAEAESAHDERLALIRTELEAKRLRLAALQATTDPVARPSRRWLEWSVPVAASALVAFLGFTLFDEEQAVARMAPVEQLDVKSEPAPAPEPEPVVAEVAPAPAPEPEVKPEPEPEVKPEPKPEPKKSTSKKSTSKKSTSKTSTDSKTESKPVIEKNKNPIKLGDFGGNPLG